MSQPENGNGNGTVTSLDEMQKSWHDLNLRIQQLEVGNMALEQENKNLRQLMERVVEHRKKSHGELVNLLTTLVSKLPINDVGVVVARLVEHNSHVGDVCSALVNGKNDDNMLQPAILKALDKTRRDLKDAIKPLVDELTKLDAPIDAAILQGLIENPESFFTPPVVRASRCFVKGQVPREKIVKEFGDGALGLFKDLTTDPKFNPRPKADEILLGFVPNFEELLHQNQSIPAGKRVELQTLYHRIRASRSSSEAARGQKTAFLKLSFVLELLHYYENQSTESPDVVFAQRLPPLIEQLMAGNETEPLDEKLVKQAEALLAHIINVDRRHAVINNFGKSGGLPRTLRYILTFRAVTFTEHDPVTVEFAKHLISLAKTPARPEDFTPVLKFLVPDMQKAVIRAMLNSGKLRKEDADPLCKTIAKELGLPETEIIPKNESGFADKGESASWEYIKTMIANRVAPNEITAAIRKRLHTKYDADEVKQSWLILAESEPLAFIRVFCLLPYLPDGQTDPIARAVLESYANRLTHEKYLNTYAKVITALKNLFKVKADSPALVNFIALVKWVDPASAEKIAADVGLPA
jgi:hypothetical protein